MPMEVFLKTIYFYLRLQFFKKDVDVVFSCSTIFNRGENNENNFFKPFQDACIKSNLSFVIFEEGDISGSFAKYIYSKDSIQMWPIILFQMILRKLLQFFISKKVRSPEFIEEKVNRLSSMLFIRNLSSKNIITLIDHKAAFWRSRFPEANILDYQHAVIYNGHYGYLQNGIPASIKTSLRIKILAQSNLVKNILINNDQSGYYTSNNIFNVGFQNTHRQVRLKKYDSIKILFTLQDAREGGAYDEEEIMYRKKVERFFDANTNFLIDNNISIVVKHHPRADIKSQQNFLSHYPFVTKSKNENLSQDFKENNLHMTFNSSSACEAAFFGIPTVFLEIEDPQHDDLPELGAKDLFIDQLKYPLINYMIFDVDGFQDLLLSKKDEIINSSDNIQKKLLDWHRLLFEEFSHESFLESLK